MSLTMLYAVLYVCVLETVRVAAQEGLGVYFVKEPESVIAVPGDEVIFTCAPNIEVDHLRWQHEWKTLESGLDPGVIVQPGRLLIRISRDPAVYKRQVGKYRCMAWMVPVGLTSLPATLRVARLGQFEARPNSTLVAPPGGTVSIQCPPPDSVPPAEVRFYKNGQRVRPRGDSVTVLADGRLHLSDLSVTSHAGLYTCSAYNRLTAETVQAPFSVLVRVRRPETRSAPPRLVAPPIPVYSAAAGETLRLECVADGWPVPVVAWKRRDGRWTDRYVQHAASLEVRGVRPVDEADFLCEAANSLGTKSAATAIKLLVPPHVETHPRDVTVPEGVGVSLSCRARGHPTPRLQWVLEGEPMFSSDNVTVREDGALVFRAVQRHNAGLYQCFAHSQLGDDKDAVLLKVDPRPAIRDGGMTSHEVEGGQSGRRKQGGERRRNSEKSNSNDRMVPPSAPKVFQLTNSSAMLKWDVPESKGLEILFFKIQYRRMPRRRYQWQTHDTDVPGSSRSFEVDGLKRGSKYKFRVLAVYDNKDNTHGPNSEMLRMVRMRPNARPVGAPSITQGSALGATSIRLHWNYNDRQSAPVHGYLIHYRSATSAGQYDKATVLPGSAKTYVVAPLMPSTVYDFKIQAFKLVGGASDFSPIVAVRTKDAAVVVGVQGTNGGAIAAGTVPVVTTRQVEESRVRLYTIVGSLLGLLLLIALLFVLVFYFRSRQKPDDVCKYGGPGQLIDLQPMSCAEVDLTGDLTCDLTDPVVRAVTHPALHGKLRGADSSSMHVPLRVSIPTPPVGHPLSHSGSNSTDTTGVPTAPTTSDDDDPPHWSGRGVTSRASPTHLPPIDMTTAGESSSPTLSSSQRSIALSQTSTAERRKRIRRRDSIEAQRHRMSNRGST